MAVSVVLVDDDAVVLASSRRLLVAAGYAVREAEGGGQALRQITAQPPDILITDILMPEGDGIELISAVRRQFPDVRIIAVTERRRLGDLDLLELALKLGADVAMDKPVEAKRLLANITALIDPGMV